MSKQQDRSAISGMIQKAKQPAAKTDKPKDDPIVTFTMNVRKSHRRWWAAQAKLQDKTMTDIATAALIKEFGLPPEK